MNEHSQGYAVFLFEQAIEVLGEPIKPYLRAGTGGAYIQCVTVDTGGAFVEMTLSVRTPAGDETELDLMVPLSMVRMIVSIHSESTFGFISAERELRSNALPVVGPDAPAARAPSESMPHTAVGSVPMEAITMDDRRRPPEG